MRQKRAVIVYATQRIHSIMSIYKRIFDESMLDAIIAELKQKGRQVKRKEWKNLVFMKMEATISSELKILEA